MFTCKECKKNVGYLNRILDSKGGKMINFLCDNCLNIFIKEDKVKVIKGRFLENK